MMTIVPEYYDISVSPSDPDAVYPHDPPTIITDVGNWDQLGYRLSQLQMSMHAGTHIDFPAHFIREGKTAADYTADHFVMPAQVADANKIEQVVSGMKSGEALLIKGNSDNLPYHFSLELANKCAAKQLALVGIDQISIDEGNNELYPVHLTLLGSGVLIMENLDLSRVAPGNYRLFCWPLKVGPMEAAPVRAILWAGENI